MPGLFEVTTRRGKQFNTLIHGEVDPINGAPRDAILINPDDAADLNVRSNDRIALVSDLGRYEGRAFFAPLARGNLQVHWPEGNVLIPAKRADQASGVPDYNARARIEVL